MGARLQLLQEVLAVEVPQLLHIPEDDAALSPQVLRQVEALHLWEVVLNDVAERADVLPFCGNHFIHDVLHFAGEQRDSNMLQETPNDNVTLTAALDQIHVNCCPSLSSVSLVCFLTCSVFSPLHHFACYGSWRVWTCCGCVLTLDSAHLASAASSLPTHYWRPPDL